MVHAENNSPAHLGHAAGVVDGQRLNTQQVFAVGDAARDGAGVGARHGPR